MKPLTILFIIFLLTACNSKTALNYSEAIIKREKSLEHSIKETEDLVKKYISTTQYDSMTYVSAKLEKEIDEQLQAIKNEKAPDVKEGDNFKRASLDYFAYMKSVYTGYVKFSKAGSEDARQEVYKDLQSIVDKKTEVIKAMRDAQAKFAKANGFRLEE
jgi:cytochrome c556